MPCELGKFIKKLRDLKEDKLQKDYGFDSQKDFEQFKQIIAQSLTELSTQVFFLLSCAESFCNETARGNTPLFLKSESFSLFK